MMKYHLRFKRKPDLRFSRSFVAVCFILFIAHEVIAFYLLTLKDKEIRRLEHELQQLSSQHDQVTRENQQLRERQRIWDIIEEFNPELSEQEKTSLGTVIWEESQRYGFDPVMLMALILTESSFRPKASSPLGAQGLMQILPQLGKELSPEVQRAHGIDLTGPQDLLDPEINIKVGTYHLFKLVLHFRDLKTAIKAYNEGATDIQRRMQEGSPLPRLYYARVLKNYRQLRQFLAQREAAGLPQAATSVALARQRPQTAFPKISSPIP